MVSCYDEMNDKLVEVEFKNCVRLNFFNNGKGSNESLVWIYGKCISDDTNISKLIDKIDEKDLGMLPNVSFQLKEKYKELKK